MYFICIHLPVFIYVFVFAFLGGGMFYLHSHPRSWRIMIKWTELDAHTLKWEGFLKNQSKALWLGTKM